MTTRQYSGSVTTSLEQDIALTLEQMDRLRGLQERQMTSLCRTECYVDTELMQMENRMPRYEPYRFPEEYIHTQCGRKRICLTNKQRRRLAVMAKPLGQKVLAEITDLFSPSTLLGWYRKLVAQKYDGTPNRKGGKPKISKEIIDLVVRLAKENRGWGHRRIRNYIIYLGYSVSCSSVLRIMEDHGMNPDPEQKRKTTWNEFVSSHMNVMAATDLFTVEILTKRGLVRVMVMFVIHLGSRRVEIAGIKPTRIASGRNKWLAT